MSLEEKRLAKLSVTLNNSSLSPNSYKKTTDDAYSDALEKLKNSLLTEKKISNEMSNKYRSDVNNMYTTQLVKELANKHNLQVLKAQIEEKLLKKKISKETPEPPSKYLFKIESPQRINFELRDELKKQIKDKEESKKIERAENVSYGQKIIEDSNKNLDEEFRKKNASKQAAYQKMIESWQQEIKVKELKKKLEKIRIYGARPESKHRTLSEIQEIIEPVEEPVKTTYVRPKPKSVEKNYNWKTSLRARIRTPTHKEKPGKSYNKIIEKFGVLNEREKAIKTDREKIMKYLKERQKFKESEGFKLPDINKHKYYN